MRIIFLEALYYDISNQKKLAANAYERIYKLTNKNEYKVFALIERRTAKLNEETVNNE